MPSNLFGRQAFGCRSGKSIGPRLSGFSVSCFCQNSCLTSQKWLGHGSLFKGIPFMRKKRPRKRLALRYVMWTGSCVREPWQLGPSTPKISETEIGTPWEEIQFWVLKAFWCFSNFEENLSWAPSIPSLKLRAIQMKIPSEESSSGTRFHPRWAPDLVTNGLTNGQLR